MAKALSYLGTGFLGPGRDGEEVMGGALERASRCVSPEVPGSQVQCRAGRSCPYVGKGAVEEDTGTRLSLLQNRTRIFPSFGGILQ